MPDSTPGDLAPDTKVAQLLVVCLRWEEARQISSYIGDHYSITVVSDGREAAEELTTRHFDALVIDDAIDGPQSRDILDTLNSLAINIPTLVMSAFPQIGIRGANGKQTIKTLRKPVSRADFLRSFAEIMDLVFEKREQTLEPMLREVMTIARPTLRRFLCTDDDDGQGYRGIMKVAGMVASAAHDGNLDDMLRLLRQHHDYTFAHSMRVGTLLAAFGREVGFNRNDLKLASLSGLVHDVGKRRVPLAILDKPGNLDPQELDVMRHHPTWSAEILRGLGGVPEEAIQVSERHHEKIDGSGYPDGLTGDKMGDLSLLSAIVDVFVALTDQRAYKNGLSVGETLKIMSGMAGDHLDPPLFDCFHAMVLEHSF